MRAPLLHAALVAALVCTSQAGWGHDSWLSVTRAAWQPGRAVLDLGTGTRYPAAEVGPLPASLARSGCSDGRRALPLQAGVRSERTLAVAASFAGGPAPLACWAELAAASIELEPKIVQVYFKDIQAPAPIREAWARLQSRGVPWQETYRKFARIELAAGRGRSRRGRWRPPAGRSGWTWKSWLLGDRPVRRRPAARIPGAARWPSAGRFPVELVSDRNPLGIWRRNRCAGKAAARLPFAGRWLLRGTDLRLLDAAAGHWESRFATLVIEAPDRP